MRNKYFRIEEIERLCKGRFNPPSKYPICLIKKAAEKYKALEPIRFPHGASYSREDLIHEVALDFIRNDKFFKRERKKTK